MINRCAIELNLLPSGVAVPGICAPRKGGITMLEADS
jgi:hypothetical protein